jgi:hypothetical protein
VGFVRVSAPEGEFTIDEGAVKGMGVTVLDKPALDGNGRPLPAKPRTTKAGQKVSASKKNEDKES